MSKEKKASRPDQNLPPAELEILACLWQRDEATARQLRDALHRYRPMAHGSVLSLLGRLENKGLVARRKGPVGKAFVYSPTRSPGPTYRRLVKDLAQRVFGGNGVALVVSLFESKPPDADELDELQRLLDQLRAKQRSKEKRS